MTIKQAKAILTRHAMTLRFVDGEYRVNFKAGSEETAYYTSCLNDAMNTAIAMLLK